VEDHSLAYANFEGLIAEGEYGAGIVMIWDRGTYIPVGTNDVGLALQEGELKFTLIGIKLKDSWTAPSNSEADRAAVLDLVDNAFPQVSWETSGISACVKQGVFSKAL
jgi:DNA ligase D-like protein (predicted 3'-phosphoesterase)